MSIREAARGVKPEIQAPVITFSVRKIMENARLERVQIDKISLAGDYPFDTHEDFAMRDLEFIFK